MSWRAQNRSKDAKTPSVGRGMSENPEPGLWPIQPYEVKRFDFASFVRCGPVVCSSGLIKVGSVCPYSRGCTVWGADGLLPTQRCIGQGPAGATGLVLREGVVTGVSVAESALAQQMPGDWVADLQLRQEQIGNAVPLGLAFHVGPSIAAYLRPHLIARSSEHRAVDEAATGHLLSSPARHGPRLSLREIRLGGFNRLAARRLEWKQWCWLQRAQLQRALARLHEAKKATRRYLRLWRAAGFRAIASRWISGHVRGRFVCAVR
jgi:hypothetical protein